MRCKKCNSLLSDDTKICPYCGANLVKKAKSNQNNQIFFQKEEPILTKKQKGCGCLLLTFVIFFSLVLIGCFSLGPIVSLVLEEENLETIINTFILEENNLNNNVEEIDIKQETEVTVLEIPAYINSNNPLLKLKEQARQSWNEDKTQIVGSFLRIIGDNYLFAECSLEDLKEFIRHRLEPFNNEHEYIVVDFKNSDNGFIYKDGIIQYGRLDKEEKTFKIKDRTELYGTIDTSNEEEIMLIIKLIGLQEHLIDNNSN